MPSISLLSKHLLPYLSTWITHRTIKRSLSLIASPDQVIAIQILWHRHPERNRASRPALNTMHARSHIRDFSPATYCPTPRYWQNTAQIQPSYKSAWYLLADPPQSICGLIGTIHFRTTLTFSNTTIRLTRAILSRDGQFETISLNISVALRSAPSPDFDGDGRVGFTDFVLFASRFGSTRGDGTYEAKYDLDVDHAIGFSDFVIFCPRLRQRSILPRQHTKNVLDRCRNA